MTDQQESRYEFSGKTVEEAVAAAAQNFGVDKDLLEVEILSQPGSLTALFGRKVRISARLKSDPLVEGLKFEHPARPVRAGGNGNGFDPVSALRHIATTILPEAVVDQHENDDQLVLDIKGDGSGIFIGRKGSTLEAIQFLMTLMAQKQGWEGKRILVDSERYHERRIDAVRDKCRQLAQRALSSGRPQSTEMLDAAMRKIVHAEIKNYGELRTKSIGNGDLKRVQIFGNNNHPPRDNGRGHDRERRPPRDRQ
ncbi:MAG: KH domain-containing protein [Myxococcales bacterium]|nr:KH domain-containing protein [Myxococcales bacterium]